MNSCTTEGITVMVETQYLSAHSNARLDKYIFGYYVCITNGSPTAVQLLVRHWVIVEAGGTAREVNGEGVVGQQPIILPGMRHEYTSFCNLNTEIGKMHGVYQMKRLDDSTLFDVLIPEFYMVDPAKLN